MDLGSKVLDYVECLFVGFGKRYPLWKAKTWVVVVTVWFYRTGGGSFHGNILVVYVFESCHKREKQNKKNSSKNLCLPVLGKQVLVK